MMARGVGSLDCARCRDFGLGGGDVWVVADGGGGAGRAHNKTCDSLDRLARLILFLDELSY
jgi:hypothetical protein